MRQFYNYKYTIIFVCLKHTRDRVSMGDCTTECFEIVVQPKPEDRRTNTGLKTHWLFSSMATFAFQFANPRFFSYNSYRVRVKVRLRLATQNESLCELKPLTQTTRTLVSHTKRKTLTLRKTLTNKISTHKTRRKKRN